MTQLKKIALYITLTFLYFTYSQGQSINPILKIEDPNFLYAADPSAEVFDGKVYLYCSHDQADAKNYQEMQDYIVLESSDLTHWTNHGVVLRPREYSWAEGQMNAPDVAYKDGWYYFYFPYNRTHIGVAKSRSPHGPWEEAVTDKITTIFDPTVFIDDDGQAYIYGSDNIVNMGYEGKQMWAAKLKDNMLELDGPWYQIASTKNKLSEGVTIFKRKGVYYWMARVNNRTGYWMADSPIPSPDYSKQPTKKIHSSKEGYASFKGYVTLGQNDAPSHMSAIAFKDQWYYFYHRGVAVNNGSYHKRSACFDPLYFNADGTIKTVNFSLEKVNKSEHGKGAIHVEAEHYTAYNKVAKEINLDIDGGFQLSNMFEGSWGAYENIDFGKNGENKDIPFFIRYYSDKRATDKSLEIRLDDKESKPIATIPLQTTNGVYETISAMLPDLSGKHTLYLTCRGNVKRKARLSVMTLNWFEYTPYK